jgi:uncharacterized membrane protein
VSEAPVHRIEKQTFDWLTRESAGWVTSGVLDEQARARLLAGYDTESTPHRGSMVLVTMAVLMCGIGVLLVIGYNWNRIAPHVKVALILTAVAAAYGGAAVAYGRNRPALGGVLAFSGVVLFGNAIWLIAQVLHIQGHFPDAFLWTAVGALATAYLVRSRACGIAGAVVVAAWLAAEASQDPRPIYPFLMLWPIAVWIAYGLQSVWMIRILALSVTVWVLMATAGSSGDSPWAGAIALTACALYAASRWHDVRSPLGEAWRSSGLAVLLAVFVPLMIGEMHEDVATGAGAVAAAVMMVIAAGALSIVVRPIRSTADWSVAITAGVTSLWSLVAWFGLLKRFSWLPLAATVVFSVLALLLCATLVRSAFAANRRSDLVFGVLFGLLFVAVRWTSLIENLLWSGLALLVAGGGLLFVARLWMRRDEAVAGRTP